MAKDFLHRKQSSAIYPSPKAFPQAFHAGFSNQLIDSRLPSSSQSPLTDVF